MPVHEEKVGDAKRENKIPRPLFADTSSRSAEEAFCGKGIQRFDSRHTCLPQLISQQAEVTPHALALAGNGQIMNYQALNTRANQLAHALRKAGVGPNVLVGICLPRSLDLVVGLLGILKAGGAYVPFDPAYPPERKHFMLEDAQITALLTSEGLLREWHPEGLKVICLDRDAALLQQEAGEEPELATRLDDRVYVIYTSGSTGRPKGVEVSHRNLLNLISWHQRAFDITAADRATQVTSPSFDATGWEIWPYLAAGASVHFPSEEARVSPAMLRDWLLENKITLTFLPTILAESMLTLAWPESAPLRYLLTGADVLQHYPSPDLPFLLINNYGPTEATVVATYGVVHPEEHPDGLPPIGRPIDNVQIYLMDEEMRQVPAGQPGELYIGGAGVATGYLNRPELTRERFVPDPFSAIPGARLYKTGDLARSLPDGQIAFLGRADYQVKIRGYRIEPNEIVAVLNTHPAVQTSAVIARDTHAGDKQLVAYVVLNKTFNVTVEDLRAALGNQLPDYMIPAIYVVIEAIPSTSNGKVDRALLPEPDEENMLRDSESVSSITPIEKRLGEIIAPLLKLEHVGVEDNFFMLGGHSLLGTQVITRISATFGINLTLRSLFDAPTVRLLAVTVEEAILEKLAAMSEEETQQLFS